LAQRSAQAAKEIKGLIEDSVSKVGAGSQQVERAGATMQEIVSSVKRVTDIMGEISAASEEQSSGIDQVNRAVSQMDEVTQQNAALVEEAAAAAGSLQEQAQRLAEAVAVFKINAGAVIDVPARPLAAPARGTPPRVAASVRSEGGVTARVAIEQVTPAVDGGAYPVKRRVQEAIAVQADIFMDGHDRLAAELRWRADDESAWQRVPLVAIGNDRWQAAFRPGRIGPHAFQIAAWFDAWETFRHELRVKRQAGVPLRLEMQEGLRLLHDTMPAARRGPARTARRDAMPDSAADTPIAQLIEALNARDADAEPDAALLDALLGDELAAAMRAHDLHPFESLSAVYPVWVDRPQATHAAWYELFPRSQAAEPGRHGTFDDVILRLPDIREMGFDVLYLPPIHPIGLANRKGRNNSLRAEPDDVGSPYAIGSPAGGHDAIEPRLGSWKTFCGWSKPPRTTAWNWRWISRSSARPTTHGWRSTRTGFRGGPTARCAMPKTRPRSTKTSSTWRSTAGRPSGAASWDCGAPCATSCCSGPSMACASSAWTTPTPSRCPSGSG
ncbi:hypothetical protein DDE05_34085, partial [Streptomyces cavourensis]